MPVYYPSSSNSSSRSSSSEVKPDPRRVTYDPLTTTTSPSNPSKPKSRLHPVVVNDPYAPKDQDRRTKEQDAGYYPRSSFQPTNSYSQSYYATNPTRAPPRGYRS